MRFLIIMVSLILACVLPAYAGGPTLFKEFSYGQPREEIQKLSGITPCDEVAAGALCRQKQSFAGYNDGDRGLVYTFAPKNALKGAAKYGSYSQFAFNAPESLRATELELSGNGMFVRFIAPKAALNDMKQQMAGQKESF